VPGPATHFVVSAPSSATAGSQFQFTVTAYDAGSNIATGYPGTVHFTTNASNATLPANATLVNGVGTFTATMRTAGATSRVTATDTVTNSITGISSAITVTPAAFARFSVSAASPETSTVSFNVTVRATDQFGNATPSYAGTVKFSS